MERLTRNDQGRYVFSSIDDKGFHRGNAILLGVAGYDSCIGRIIGRILSLFGLTVRMELDSSDQSKKAYVWVPVSSIKNLVERNTDQGITNKSIECPKSFNSETVEKLVLDVKEYKEKKERETWIPIIFGKGGPLEHWECPHRESFFKLARNNTYPELKGLKEDLEELWKCTQVKEDGRFEVYDYSRTQGRYCFFEILYGRELKTIGFCLDFFTDASKNTKKEALMQFHEAVKMAIASYKKP